MATTDVKPDIFIDTNVLIRYSLSTAPSHQESQAAIQKLWDEKREIWISRQVLREYASVLTRPQAYSIPLTSEVIGSQLEAFQAQFHVVDETAFVTSGLIALLKEIPTGGKQVHDANIVATMQVNKLTQLLTLNTADFMRFSKYITLFSLEDILSS